MPLPPGSLLLDLGTARCHVGGTPTRLSGEARDEEVHHGPQLQEGIVQGRVDQEQALLAAHKPETMCESPRHGKLGRRC